MQSIGFLELNSIAKGIEASDFILKTAEVSLVFARCICPGKYNILFCGEVAAVAAAMEAGKASGGRYVIDDTVIARVHPQVTQAINSATVPQDAGAVGVMEFFSITAAVYAADAAVKAAEVTLIDIRLGAGIGGKSFVCLTGSVAAVNEAVACGEASVGGKGLLVASVVIPNPRKEIYQSLL